MFCYRALQGVAVAQLPCRFVKAGEAQGALLGRDLLPAQEDAIFHDFHSAHFHARHAVQRDHFDVTGMRKGRLIRRCPRPKIGFIDAQRPACHDHVMVRACDGDGDSPCRLVSISVRIGVVDGFRQRGFSVLSGQCLDGLIRVVQLVAVAAVLVQRQGAVLAPLACIVPGKAGSVRSGLCSFQRVACDRALFSFLHDVRETLYRRHVVHNIDTYRQSCHTSIGENDPNSHAVRSFLGIRPFPFMDIYVGLPVHSLSRTVHGNGSISALVDTFDQLRPFRKPAYFHIMSLAGLNIGIGGYDRPKCFGHIGIISFRNFPVDAAIITFIMKFVSEGSRFKPRSEVTSRRQLFHYHKVMASIRNTITFTVIPVCIRGSCDFRRIRSGGDKRLDICNTQTVCFAAFACQRRHNQHFIASKRRESFSG